MGGSECPGALPFKMNAENEKRENEKKKGVFVGVVVVRVLMRVEAVPGGWSGEEGLIRRCCDERAAKEAEINGVAMMIGQDDDADDDN